MKNVPCHIEFISSDIEKTTRFYAKLFGWEVVNNEIPDYFLLRFAAEYPVGGAIRVHAGRANTSHDHEKANPLLYIRVEAIERVLVKIKAYEGKILTETVTVPGRGCYAHFADGDGNILGLWQENSSE
ncbi:MAG: hypothetical protein GF344_08105 [Chitinivibrionales bacterium]|nr:hypothetical protein [Chitinivibrionales bacterium]